jgi:type 1 glutamine amidotransferase
MPIPPSDAATPADPGPPRRALVVRGGWEGHAPLETTELFIPALRTAGFHVEVADSLDVYCDTALMADTDLVVQCWSEGILTESQSRGLVAAVTAGTGFAGWHGGVLAAFPDRAFQRMVGGVFLFHPPEFLTYRVDVDPGLADHPIMTGLADFDVHSEQYWVLTDDRNTVLATTAVAPEDGEHGPDPVRMPVVWTRRWGAGKVFVSTIGHRVDDLREPTVRTLTERGLVWAAR